MDTLSMNLYDRQIRTYGIDALLKITSCSVLIYGLEGGLATEVGKNLALGGIKKIYLFDDESIIDRNDLLTGYYYVNSLNENRSKVLSLKLQELNQYCIIKTTKKLYVKQNVTIIINKTKEEINNITKLIDSKFVILYSKFIDNFGANGCIFVDAGLKHTIIDPTGESIDSIHIKTITSDGTIVCISNHNLDDNSIITFYNLEGNNLDDLNKEWTIKIINKISFKLDNFSIKSFSFINGMVKIIQKPIIINHIPFNEFNYSELNKDIINYYLSLKSFNKLFDFMPTVSLFGSFGASEVIKLITNKYIPCNQWLIWNDNKVTYNNNFKDINVFIVGAGAIGCELLKNFAMLNIGVDNSNIIITDYDNIETSNLNRQFLFRNKDINKPKSVVAAESIKKMNTNINIKSLLEKVGSNNIRFTDSVLNSKITAVFNALDNINARKFMDEQCLIYGIPLFESGTTGTKGNTQPIIPFITETYSAYSDPETEKVYPVCTIKSFPNEISHTIYWAMDQFELFNRLSNTENKQFITQYNISDYINFAFKLFDELYYNNINKLLLEFPKDHKIDNNILFWSGGKKCPTPIIFDINNKNHLDFIINTIKIITKYSGLEYNITNELIINHKMQNNNRDELEYDFQQYCSNFKVIYFVEEFNKDNELHMDWINIASNLRAMNYNIQPVDIYETKGIAGKIIPAISTTTSAVAGLIVMEFIKYLNKSSLEDYRSTYINLAGPLIVYSEPICAPMIKIAGIKINSWSQFKYSTNSTLKEFKQYYDNLFKTNINMIVFNSAMVYADFLNDDILEKPILNIISDLELKNNSGIIANIFNEESTELPNIVLNI